MCVREEKQGTQLQPIANNNNPSSRSMHQQKQSRTIIAHKLNLRPFLSSSNKTIVASSSSSCRRTKLAHTATALLRSALLRSRSHTFSRQHPAHHPPPTENNVSLRDSPTVQLAETTTAAPISTTTIAATTPNTSRRAGQRAHSRQRR